MRRLAILSVAALITGCAQVRDISGGDKDATGPVLLSSNPPNGSVRFSGDRFTLRFDERIQVERPRTGLLVSPPLDPPPTIQVSGGREVEVRLRAPLQPNTTYTFSIGEAVKDLTEGNRAVGLDYVFSTGETLDSLEVTGTVRHAFTGKPQEDVLVMLIPDSDTAAFTSGRPTFATRTSTGGAFGLRHLPAGRFRVVALRDLNGNYRFDLPAEEIAFIEQAVEPSMPRDSTARHWGLRLFQETSPVQRVMEAAVTEDRALRLVLAKPAERIRLRDVQREGGQLSWEAEWGNRRDSVLLWPSDTTAVDLGRYEVGTEEGILDTIRYRPLRPMPYNLSLQSIPVAERSSVEGLFRSSRPLARIDTSRIQIFSDSAAVPFEVSVDTFDTRLLQLATSLRPDQRANVVLLPKALHDIYGGSHDTLRFSLGGFDEKGTGILRVTLTGDSALTGPLMLELLDAQGQTVRRASVVAGQAVTWDKLVPGNHTMRLIADANGNGRWDPGRWSTGLEPERVWLNSETVNVRAAWDLGITWKLVDH